MNSSQAQIVKCVVSWVTCDSFIHYFVCEFIIFPSHSCRALFFMRIKECTLCLHFVAKLKNQLVFHPQYHLTNLGVHDYTFPNVI